MEGLRTLGVSSFFVILISIFNGWQPRHFFKYASERFVVSITNVIHHFIYVFPAAFHTLLCGLYFHPLYIFHNRIGCCLLESPFQVPPAKSKHTCQLIHGDLFLEIILYKFLGLFYGFIFMRFWPVNIRNGDWLWRSISIINALAIWMAISRPAYFSTRYKTRFRYEYAPPLV